MNCTGEIVLPDHYATLGIAPSSRAAAIRAAYLELMRRCHPDRNSSDAGAARVRAITAAYAVLGAPDRRAAYDLQRTRLLLAESSVFMPERPQWRLTPFLAVSFGLVVIVLLLPLLIPPPLSPPERSGPASSVGGRQQAAPLEQDQIASGWNPAALCAAPAAADIMKRELFRRAARLRGSDRAAYDRLAVHSLIRIDSPALAKAKSETVSCNASVAVALPPGVAAVGGQRIVTGKVSYSLRVDGSYSSLITDGPIVGLLATLAQTSGQAADAADPSAASEDGARGEPPKIAEQMTSPAQPPEAAVTRAQPIQPRLQPRAAARTAGPAAGAGQTPAWQQPLKPAWQQPLKPAWQQPLPPAND